MEYQQWPDLHRPSAAPLAPPGTTPINCQNPNPNPNPNHVYQQPQQLYSQPPASSSSYYYPPNPNSTAYTASDLAGAQIPAAAQPSGYAEYGNYESSTYVPAYSSYPLASQAAASGDATAAYYYGDGGTYDPAAFATHSLVGPVLPRNSLIPYSISTKKGLKFQKKGTQVVQSVSCDICRIECNSQEVLIIHKQGKKHAKNLLKLQDSLKLNPAAVVVPGLIEKAVASLKGKVLGLQTKKSQPYMHSLVGTLPRNSLISSSRSTNKVRKFQKARTQVVQSVFCEICRIQCNSHEVLVVHKQGRKHKNNLQKLQDSLKPKPAAVVVQGPKEKAVAEKDKAPGAQAKKKAPAIAENLEAKKRKLLDGGAAAREVKVCTICNIAVNSQKVFDYHIMGQKHAAMVKKKQEEQSSKVAQ